MKYTNRGLKDASKEGCQIVPNSFYKNLKSYKLVEMEDYYSYSKVFNHIPNLNPDDILNESFYLLKKQ
ncbi:hypothetical protein N9M71_01785 [Winogradskyella sp.]|nr:hypothetical protein [Winogradskyella sp.]